MVTFAVEGIEEITIAPGSPVDHMDQMSPFVWKQDGAYRIMLRGVPTPLKDGQPTGVIAWGKSSNGLDFSVDQKLAIVPGDPPQDPDAGGCEDPTVLPRHDGTLLVWYTGVDAARRQGCLMLASGNGPHCLEKHQVTIRAPEDEGNIKEATLVRTTAGDWRLFYEYASQNASRIGLARGSGPEGPWDSLDDPFTVRDEGWDNWHLSTGPIFFPRDGDPVMFYNGATDDARWRIGWITFDRDFTRVTGRGIEPLLQPPPPNSREAVDIAFAASTVPEGDRIALYYSLDDRRLMRCLVRRYT